MNEGNVAIIIALLSGLAAVGSTLINRRLPAADSEQTQESEIRKELREENKQLKEENKQQRITNGLLEKQIQEVQFQNIQLLQLRDKYGLESVAWETDRRLLKHKIHELEKQVDRLLRQIADIPRQEDTNGNSGSGNGHYSTDK